MDLLHPKSRGTVGIASKDAREAPVIDPNFFDQPDDMKTLIEGVKTQMRILESKPFDAWRGKLLYPVKRDDELN